MLARPAAVLVLNAVEVVGDLLVPLLPFLAALDEKRFADVHVAEELFAAVGAEAGDELLVAQLLDQPLRGGFIGFLHLGEIVQVLFGFVFRFLGGAFVGKDFASLFLAQAIGVDGVLQAGVFRGAVINADAGVARRAHCPSLRNLSGGGKVPVFRIQPQ